MPFRILQHPAGTTVDLEIAPPLTLPTAVPQPGDFEVFRKSNGEDSRPASWDERIAVIPIGAQQVYQYILELGILMATSVQFFGTAGSFYEVGASGSTVRGWLGVSAADSENYIADQIPAAAPFGGRPGNESGVAAAQIQAAFYGRPVFSPPEPLPDVPVALLDEVRSDELLLPLLPAQELPGLAISGHRLRLERISAAAVLPFLKLSEDEVAVVSPDDPAISQIWHLAASDEAELRQAMARGSQFVPAKYFWAMATNGLFPMEKLWEIVAPQPVDYLATTLDRLPNKAERYIYRVRLADTTGRISAAAAHFPRVWRTPDKSLPPAPSIVDLRFRKIETPAPRAFFSVKIQLQAAISGTTKGILVFAASLPGVGNLENERQELARSRVAKIPNRPDLPPAARTRLSLPDGRLVEPVFLEKTAAIVQTSSQTAVLIWENIEMEVPYESLGGVWAAAVSEDNILSPLAGPRMMAVGAAEDV